MFQVNPPETKNYCRQQTLNLKWGKQLQQQQKDWSNEESRTNEETINALHRNCNCVKNIYPIYHELNEQKMFTFFFLSVNEWLCRMKILKLNCLRNLSVLCARYNNCHGSILNISMNFSIEFHSFVSFKKKKRRKISFSHFTVLPFP